MKKVAIITGITGQDGAYLAKHLVERNYDVIGFSPRRSSPNTWRLEYLNVLKDVTLVTGDVTDAHSVDEVVYNFDPDEIYNLAAQSFVKASFDCPSSTIQANTMGAVNFLEAIRKYNKGIRFYQASTSEMFGLVNVEGQNEDTPMHPRSPYGVSKLAAHWATINYREAYGIHASCGILFNHESPLRGIEFVTRKVTDGIAQIIAGKRPDLVMGNMDAFRDWGFAGDFVEAMWLMLQKETPDDYVISTGKAYSVEQMVDYAFACVGRNAGDYVRFDPAFLRPSDVPYLCGDSSKATEELGWVPNIPFETLIKEMLKADLERHNVDFPTLYNPERINAA